MTHQDFVNFALVSVALAAAFVICLLMALSKLDRIAVGLNAVKDELESIQIGIESIIAPSTGDIEDLLERICGALGAPPDVRPMVRALTALRDAIDKAAVPGGPQARERAERAVFTAKLRLDQSVIPCAAQGELREVMMGLIQARDERADTTDLRAKIELAISALSTALRHE